MVFVHLHRFLYFLAFFICVRNSESGSAELNIHNENLKKCFQEPSSVKRHILGSQKTQMAIDSAKVIFNKLSVSFVRKSGCNEHGSNTTKSRRKQGKAGIKTTALFPKYSLCADSTNRICTCKQISLQQNISPKSLAAILTTRGNLSLPTP